MYYVCNKLEIQVVFANIEEDEELGEAQEIPIERLDNQDRRVQYPISCFCRYIQVCLTSDGRHCTVSNVGVSELRDLQPSTSEAS